MQNNYNVGRPIQLKVVPSKNLTGTFLGKFTLKFLKPYVVLLTRERVHKVNDLNQEILYELRGTTHFDMLKNLRKRSVISAGMR